MIIYCRNLTRCRLQLLYLHVHNMLICNRSNVAVLIVMISASSSSSSLSLIPQFLEERTWAADDTSPHHTIFKPSFSICHAAISYNCYHNYYILCSLSLYVIGRPSVCLLRSYALLRRLKFSAMFLHHLVRWPSADIQVKFYGDRPRGTPQLGELNTRGVAEYIDCGPIERCISEMVQDRS